ncbi:hypothetical protein A2U01_0064326, partial [Trifolium medium]|nr:hypothetical protein [Trifolium medium]
MIWSTLPCPKSNSCSLDTSAQGLSREASSNGGGCGEVLNFDHGASSLVESAHEGHCRGNEDVRDGPGT